MTDPQRFLHGAGTEFERSLLGAAANERPSPEMTGQMRSALDLSGSGSVAMSTLGAKIGAGIVMAGLLAAGLWSAGFGESPTRVVGHTPTTVTAKAHPPTLEMPAPVPEPEATPAPPKEPVRLAQKPARPPPRTDSPTSALAEEVRLLDRARRALNAGESPTASKWLERYRQRFPNGALGPEARALSARVATTRHAEKEAARGVP